MSTLIVDKSVRDLIVTVLFIAVVTALALTGVVEGAVVLAALVGVTLPSPVAAVKELQG